MKHLLPFIYAFLSGAVGGCFVIAVTAFIQMRRMKKKFKQFTEQGFKKYDK